MADLNGALIEDLGLFSSPRFTGKSGRFIPGGEDPVITVRYYTLRGWDPSTSSWEAWTSKLPGGRDNPNGRPLQYVSLVPFEKRLRSGEE